jgi:hypothetical protein
MDPAWTPVCRLLEATQSALQPEPLGHTPSSRSYIRLLASLPERPEAEVRVWTRLSDPLLRTAFLRRCSDQ